MNYSKRTGYTLSPIVKKCARILIPGILVATVILDVCAPSGTGILHWMIKPTGNGALLPILAGKARSLLLLSSGLATIFYCTKCSHPFLYLMVTLMTVSGGLASAVFYGIYLLF